MNFSYSCVSQIGTEVMLDNFSSQPHILGTHSLVVTNIIFQGLQKNEEKVDITIIVN